MMQLLKLNETTIPAVKGEVERTHSIFNSLAAINLAKKEIEFGNSAAASLSKSANDTWAAKQLAEISVWHYQSGIEKLKEAIRILEQVRNGNSSIKTKYFITQHIIECRNLIGSTKNLLLRATSAKTAEKTKARKIVRIAKQTLMPLGDLIAKA